MTHSCESNPFGYIHYMDESSSRGTPNQPTNLLIEDDDLITLVLPSDEGGEEERGGGNMEDEEGELVEYESEEMLFLLPKSLLRSPSLRSSVAWSASSHQGPAQDCYSVSSLYLSQEELADGSQTSVADRSPRQPLSSAPNHWETLVGPKADGISPQPSQQPKWGGCSKRLLQPPEDLSWERWHQKDMECGGWQSPTRVPVGVHRVASVAGRPLPGRPRPDQSQPLQHAVSVPALSLHGRLAESYSGGRHLTKSPCRAKVVLSCESDSDPESPPSWISCFASPRAKRKVYNKDTVEPVPRAKYLDHRRGTRKAAAAAPEPIRYIDETPSGSSADLVYGSPVLVDYENFNRRNFVAEKSCQTVRGARRKSRSLSRPRRSEGGQRGTSGPRSYDDLSDQTERLNLKDNSRISFIAGRLPSAEHNTPQPLQYLQDAGSYRVTTKAQVEDNGIQPPFSPSPPTSYAFYRDATNYMVPYTRRCTCESRRSSDSGLADVSGHADICPLSPLLGIVGKGSLQSVTSLPNSSGYPGSPRLSRRQSSSFGGRRMGSAAATGSSILTVASPSEPIYLSSSSHNYYTATPLYASRDLGETSGFPQHSANFIPCGEQRSTQNLPSTGPTISASLQAPSPLYRCSCGQEIRWGTIAPADSKGRVSAPTAAQQYSVSLDDLAVYGKDGAGRDGLLAADLDQALSCIDIPTTTATGFPVHKTNLNLPPYFSPPLVRRSTQQTLSDPRPAEEEESSLSTTAARSSWPRTKETYKTGLYAHRWLNASLQPIWDDTIEAAGLYGHAASSLDTETSL